MTENEKIEIRKAMEVIGKISLNDWDELFKTTDLDREKSLSVLKLSSNGKSSNEKRVANVLHEIGIPSNIKGYKYLTTCMCFIKEDKTYIDNITHRLYFDVAEKHSTTPARVEKAIRHSIGVAFERGNKKLLDSIFGATIDPNKLKPTNKQFIYRMSEVVGILE